MQGTEAITSRLESVEISYCIVGGLAAIAYGRPRMTLDMDLVIALAPADLMRLYDVFPSEDFYLPPEEVLLSEIQRESRGHFNIIHQHSALRADCYLPGNSLLARWELENRTRLQGPFGEAWFAPPDSVIVGKLLFYREGGSAKHVEDIRSILKAGYPRDQSALLRWIKDMGLGSEWDEVNS